MIEVLPPETLAVYGFPAGPEPEALETDEFPAALGWLNWLSTRRWPGVARLATAREAFYRFEQTPTGVWLQLCARSTPSFSSTEIALRADLVCTWPCVRASESHLEFVRVGPWDSRPCSSVCPDSPRLTTPSHSHQTRLRDAASAASDLLTLSTSSWASPSRRSVSGAAQP